MAIAEVRDTRLVGAGFGNLGPVWAQQAKTQEISREANLHIRLRIGHYPRIDPAVRLLDLQQSAGVGSGEMSETRTVLGMIHLVFDEVAGGNLGRRVQAVVQRLYERAQCLLQELDVLI